MSRYLVMLRIPYEVTPLDEWIGDVADRVTLLTAEETRDRYEGRFARVVGVPDYGGRRSIRCRNNAGDGRAVGQL